MSVQVIPRAGLVWEWLLDNNGNSSHSTTANNITFTWWSWTLTDRWYQYYNVSATSSSWGNTNWVFSISFLIYPTTTNQTILTGWTNKTVWYNSSNVLTVWSAITNPVFYVNWINTNQLILNAWNAVTINHDTVDMSSLNICASSYTGKIQDIRFYSRQITQQEIQTLYLEWFKKLWWESYSWLLDGLVWQLRYEDWTDTLYDLIRWIISSKTSGTTTTDNLWFNKAVTNPNYTWTSVTYITWYTFEDNWWWRWIVTTPSWLSATGINRTTTLREIFLFNRTLSAWEVTQLQDICNKKYILPY